MTADRRGSSPRKIKYRQSLRAIAGQWTLQEDPIAKAETSARHPRGQWVEGPQELPVHRMARMGSRGLSETPSENSVNTQGSGGKVRCGDFRLAESCGPRLLTARRHAGLTAIQKPQVTETGTSERECSVFAGALQGPRCPLDLRNCNPRHARKGPTGGLMASTGHPAAGRAMPTPTIQHLIAAVRSICVRCDFAKNWPIESS